MHHKMKNNYPLLFQNNNKINLRDKLRTIKLFKKNKISVQYK